MAGSIGTIAPAAGGAERRGVWATSGHENVTDRIVQFIQVAKAEVGYVTVEALVDEAVLDVLAAAHERSVDVTVASVMPSDDEDADEAAVWAIGEDSEVATVVRSLVLTALGSA